MSGPIALVVDDDGPTRLITRAILQAEGIQVEEAADGRDAIEIIERVTPDIILLDLVMPGMDGLECCRRVRQHAASRDTPILVVSGSLDAHTDDLTAAGATALLSKPVRPSELLEQIRTLLPRPS